MRKTDYYYVAPRYTAGSPGFIGEQLALRVAHEEKTSYERTLTGIFGEDEKWRAEKLGLAGIVEQRIERKNGWDVLDILTREKKRYEEVPAKKLLRGDYIRHASDQRLIGRTVLEVPSKSHGEVCLVTQTLDTDPQCMPDMRFLCGELHMIMVSRVVP